MYLVDALNSLASFNRGDDVIDDVNAFYHKDFVFDLDFASDIGRQAAIACIDLARFQRAAECAGQSATRGRNDVIQCGRMGRKRFGAGAVMLSDRSMNPENDGSGFCWKISATHRACLALNANV